MKTEEKPIEKVTTDNLDAVLRMCKIEIDTSILDKIIDVVELIEDKGNDITLSDIFELQELWKPFNGRIIR